MPAPPVVVKVEPLPEQAVALCRERFGITEFPPEGPVIPGDRLLELARALKEELNFGFFVYCAAAHYPASGEVGEEDYQPDRSRIAYRVRRLPNKATGQTTATFPFQVWTPTDAATPSLCSIWAGADWQEREQFDLVGCLFSDHPDLRRIMMPEDWPGHPLRRDYAIDTSHFPWR